MEREVSESCVDNDGLLTEMVATYTNRFCANKPELADRGDWLSGRSPALRTDAACSNGVSVFARYTMERPRFSDPLEAIMFICKDFWFELFKKQIDNLKTNHRDNRFRWLSRISTDPSVENAKSQAATDSKAAQATMHAYFPCGILRGALSNLGIPCAVSADISNLPACSFFIRIKA